MRSFVAVTFVLLSIFLIRGTSSSYPVGDIRNCPTEQTVNPGSSPLKMDAIPDHGFDNLRNIELGQVYSKNYSSCQVSDDGRYFLPDNFNLIPVRESEIDTFAEVFQHYSEHTSSSSVSINAEASASCVFAHASGKFSAEYQNTKKKMVSTKLSSVRFGVRHHLFSVHVNPVSQLHPSFKSRLMDLAAHIQNNDTQMAHYLSDLIVRDYGTHVVTSVELGGTLYQTSFVAKESIVESDHMQLSVDVADSIKVGFIATLSLSSNFGWSRSTSSDGGTNAAIHHTRTSTRGGPPFNIYGFNYTKWQA
ncbi:PREDICTED: macrophage-expressed gene 1 protein-like [Amphimedon queenslandica]|uniref:MACPF domain-containing protein n=1 Tax=Amphimedon queenslandica TaxID=400682 RepID=A0A1X7U9C9_AMPQE|nr:PREDICTED: macrophage-expressed gene 1 protein-like [Amphimedon queenslandica]|eukprot:XP_011405694.1 PREDICTED: macrophage-expressed gene 1 protein-like [Amphimedon queenslandica]